MGWPVVTGQSVAALRTVMWDYLTILSAVTKELMVIGITATA
jgi:hypothetical protein